MDLNHPSVLLKLRLRAKAFLLEYFTGDEFQAAIRRWYADEGDRRLRYIYSLDSDSVVLDIGGYHGDFSAEISKRYGSRVYLFEPAPGFHAHCENRMRDQAKVYCMPYGLSDKNETIPMALAEDASGIYNPKNAKAPEVLIRLRAFDEVFRELNLSRVDLVKINIEGGEYPLLEHLLDTGLIGSIEHLQVQFHTFVEKAVDRRNSIRSRLLETHSLDWNYPFVWESWTRRKNK